MLSSLGRALFEITVERAHVVNVSHDSIKGEIGVIKIFS